MPEFKVVSDYTPSGDQPQAIEALAEGLASGIVAYMGSLENTRKEHGGS